MPVDDVAVSVKHSSKATNDIAKLSASKLAETERSTLVAARLGQGRFRSMVLRHWSYRCALTGVTTGAAIRASHIKPWRHSTNAQRLDSYNGLPLVATIDTLFDAGYISFDGSGRILISDRLSATERVNLGVKTGQSIGKVHAQTKRYLEYHRSNVFLDGKNAR